MAREGEVYLIRDQLVIFDLPEPKSKSQNQKEAGFVKTLEKWAILPVDVKNRLDAFLASKLHGWISTRAAKANRYLFA